MDMGSIAAAVSGLKTASDIAQAMVGIRDTTIIQTKTIELQQVILTAQSSGIAAQSEQFTLLERIRNLEEKLTRVEAWEAQKKKYTLNEVKPGAFAYLLKEKEGEAEPPHQICANCCDVHQKRSILQKETFRIGRAEALVCPNCGARIYTRGFRHEGH